jgi:transmembrane sensor
MNRQDLYDLLQRYHDNTASDEEVRVVRSWMLLTETDEESLTAEELSSAKENIWNKLLMANELPVEDVQEETKVVRFRIWRYAAAVALFASLGLMAYLFRYPILDIVDPIASTTIETGAYEIKRAVLPDSSIVTIAENSKLVFPNRFRGNSRPVEMTGKAFFNIQRNVNMPFKVFSDDIDVEVLGTSFEVNNPHKGDTAMVTVITGKVGVSNHGQASTVALPNQQVLLFKKTSKLMLQEVGNTEAYTEWLDYRLNFEEVSLVSVLDKISEIFKVRIDFDKDLIKTRDTFSGLFKNNESLSDVLDIVCLSTGLQWKRSRNDSIIITR